MPVPQIKPDWRGGFSKRVKLMRIHNSAESFSEDRYRTRMEANLMVNREAMDETFRLIESDCPDSA